MTEQRFSSKFESGSLALRVFFVCFIFLIIPLILYSFIIYNNDYELKLKDVFLFILILGGAGTFWMTRRMARPLKALTQVMARVREGDLTARFQKDCMGFEINVLGNQFNQMLDAFVHHMESAKKERAAKELFESELKIGYQIQKSLLPPQVPYFEGLDIAAGFLSAKEVAGDFYDLYELDGKLLIAIADAAGKGVSACLYSLCVRSLLRSFATASLDLAEIVKRTNALFCLDTKDSGVFVTAWVGLYDPLTAMLEYTSCGHCPPLLKKRDQTVVELKTAGTALGVIPFNYVETASVPFHQGDALLLYTDGIREAHNARGKLFGKTRLLELFKENTVQRAQALIDTLLSEVAHFATGVPQHDDLTLLMIRKT